MNEHGTRNDAESCSLASRLAADLDGSFEEIVLAFQGRLYGFAFNLCQDRQDAEEITQDAFVRAYRALLTYSPERRAALLLRPWLYQILLNVARNRRRGRRATTVHLEAAGAEVRSRVSGSARPLEADSGSDPEAVTDRAATATALAAHVAALPARYRAAVVLRHVEGFSYAEVAEVLGQPIGTVKSNVHRGTRELRAMWRASVKHEEE